MTKLPIFAFELSNPKHENFGHITVCNRRFHPVNNSDEFYKALGYSSEIRAIGLLPDEFIWDRYNRQPAINSAKCLQPKIAEYLAVHSAKFKAEYGRGYVNMLGSCESDAMTDNDLCASCIKQPKHSEDINADLLEGDVIAIANIAASHVAEQKYCKTGLPQEKAQELARWAEGTDEMKALVRDYLKRGGNRNLALQLAAAMVMEPSSE